MTCISPVAPCEETAFGSPPDSVRMIDLMRFAGTPYFAAACCTYWSHWFTGCHAGLFGVARPPPPGDPTCPPLACVQASSCSHHDLTCATYSEVCPYWVESGGV